jgi:uncharacterized protein YcbX
MIEHGDKIGITGVVEYNETGIDGDRGAAIIDGHGIGVTAKAGFGIKRMSIANRRLQHKLQAAQPTNQMSQVLSTLRRKMSQSF